MGGTTTTTTTTAITITPTTAKMLWGSKHPQPETAEVLVLAAPSACEMETQHISIWDFAYATGACPLAAAAAAANQDAQGGACPLLRHKPKLLSLRPWSSRSDEGGNDTATATTTTSTTATTTTTKSKSKQPPQIKTYLVSASTLRSFLNPFTRSTLRSLLQQPHTRLVMLVPASQIRCPRTRELLRLPRVTGCGLWVVPAFEMGGLPKDPARRAALGEAIAAKLRVEIGAGKKLGTSRFDAFLPLEEEVGEFEFLEAVGRAVWGKREE